MTTRDTFERRDQARKDVLWHGTVTLEDQTIHSCLVSDVSMAGTLIVCEAAVNDQDEMMLKVDGLGIFGCQVRWHCNNKIGLELVMGQDLLLKRFNEASTEAVPTENDIFAATSN